MRASFTSLAFSLSFVLRSGQRELIGKLLRATLCIAVAGLIGVFALEPLSSLASHWLPAWNSSAE